MYEKPNIRILLIWQIRTILFCLLPSLLVSLFFAVGSVQWRIATVLWVFCALALVFVYFPVRYLRAAFLLQGDWLLIKEGAVYARTRWVPTANIQFITVIQTPLEALFSLKSIVCHQAGGRAFVTGLTEERAALLAQELKGADIL